MCCSVQERTYGTAEFNYDSGVLFTNYFDFFVPVCLESFFWIYSCPHLPVVGSDDCFTVITIALDTTYGVVAIYDFRQQQRDTQHNKQKEFVQARSSELLRSANKPRLRLCCKETSTKFNIRHHSHHYGTNQPTNKNHERQHGAWKMEQTRLILNMLNIVHPLQQAMEDRIHKKIAGIRRRMHWRLCRKGSLHHRTVW